MPDDETLWSAQQWENAGIPVYFFSGTPGSTDSNYRHANVHAKIMVIDDRLLRVGSSNLNNRSMGFDTECDLAVEVTPGPR